VQPDQDFLHQIFGLMIAQPEAAEAPPDQAAERLRNLTQQALVGGGVSAAPGAHGFSPDLFA
jgi:hypothetical protein